MTTSTLTLSDFLLQRIAEDEEVAQAATPGPWRVCAEGSEGSRFAPDCEDKRERTRFIGIANGRVQPEDGRNAAHIARHDPARVLAECEAKRRVVEMAEGARSAAEMVATLGTDDLAEAIARAAHATAGAAVALLAAVYADHPDFREE